MKDGSTERGDVASSYDLDIGGHLRALQTLCGASSAMRGCAHGGTGPGDVGGRAGVERVGAATAATSLDDHMERERESDCKCKRVWEARGGGIVDATHQK